MLDGYSIRKIDLSDLLQSEQLHLFLAEHDLRFEEDITVAYGVFDADERLAACGCAAGALLKCFAVAEELHRMNILGSLIPALMQDRFRAGMFDLFIITRICHEAAFAACGFYALARTETLVILENRKNGPELFASRLLSASGADRSIGAVIMNCNPFTSGHRYLIEQAVAACDFLYVFVVEQDASLFSTESRLTMVQEGVADLPHVRVCLGGPYMISASTFPTYFLKKGEAADELCGRLDAVLFAERIAPALRIKTRFVGAEPLDPFTARYNAILREVLPVRGIAVREFPRLQVDNEFVSGSLVRRLYRERDWDRLSRYLPYTSLRYLKGLST